MAIHARSIPVKTQEVALQLPIFQNLSENERDLIFSHLNYQKIEKGDVVFKEGSSGNQCYFILSGVISVAQTLSTGQQQVLTKLKVGEMFGQIALIDRKPRSASCYASQTCELLSLSGEHFDILYSSQSAFAYKIIDQIVMDLSKRLRGATEQLYKANQSKTAKQRTTHSLRALQMLSAGQDWNELEQIEWVASDFEQKLSYTRPDEYK